MTYSNTVQFEINIKLSTINSKCLIARKEIIATIVETEVTAPVKWSKVVAEIGFAFCLQFPKRLNQINLVYLSAIYIECSRKYRKVDKLKYRKYKKIKYNSKKANNAKYSKPN